MAPGHGRYTWAKEKALLGLHRQMVEAAARVQELSGRSAVEAECRERRQRLTLRWQAMAGRRRGERGAASPAG